VTRAQGALPIRIAEEVAFSGLTQALVEKLRAVLEDVERTLQERLYDSYDRGSPVLHFL
jgi:hypothetical protein